MDTDPNVVQLNKDLTGIEEVMKQSMQPRKFRYTAAATLSIHRSITSPTACISMLHQIRFDMS